jgi:hypothetical protein
MTRTIRLSVALGMVLFVVGVLVGQQIRRSKFEKYLRPATATTMDVAVLRANLEVIRGSMALDTPRIYYDSSRSCFVAHAVVTSELTKKPLEEVRTRLRILAAMARHALETEFQEMSKPGVAPDRDFRMTFFELNLKDPDASRDLAEYVDGNVVFK